MFMEKDSFKFTLFSFLTWRVLLFLFLFLAIQIWPLQSDFLGGGLQNYLNNPYFWAWSNFDGEHYVRIARDGYGPFSYFFFPLYPLVVRYWARMVGDNVIYFTISGLLVSHTALLIGLVGLWKLIKLDYKVDIANLTILLLLLFPTSFYFGSIYTESLFLSLVVWSFYFARKKHWFIAGLLGGLSTATRITGLALFPALLVEYFGRTLKTRSFKTQEIASIFLVPLGLFIYMVYLKNETGDSLIFFHSLNKVFGEQRSQAPVILPQVFYRYIFKVIPNINYDYFPVVFTTLLEFTAAILFLFLTLVLFMKSRLSYAVFSAGAYLISTLTGSFSSLPRYVLVIFPAFILIAVYLNEAPNKLKVAVILVFLTLLAVATSLFTRAYWIS